MHQHTARSYAFQKRMILYMHYTPFDKMFLLNLAIFSSHFIANIVISKGEF